MPYISFSLERVQRQFHLSVRTDQLFADIQPIGPSQRLRETLDEQVPLALASLTEKARSELIITPILVEAWRHVRDRATLFSGVTFDIDPAADLVGVCDFVYSGEPNAATVTAPVVIVVEAKNDDMRAGLGQCAAELVAAQRFNQSQGENGPVLGVVTTGTLWRFAQIRDENLVIDRNEQSLDDLPHILAVLVTEAR